MKRQLISLLLSLISWLQPVLAQPNPYSKSPETAEQLLERGSAYIRLGDLAKAIANFQASISKNPNLTAAHYNLGLALAQSGKPKEAIRAFYQSILLKPDMAIAYSNIAAASLEIGDRKTAIIYSKKAIELSPNLAIAYYNLGLSLKQQDINVAIAQLQKSESLDANPQTLYNLGLLIQETGNLDKAQAYYRKAIAINPKYAEANYNLGALLLIQAQNQLQISEAIAYFQQAVIQKQDYANAYYGLGLAQARLGKTLEAKQSLIKAQALFSIQKNDKWAIATAQQIKNLPPQI
jgi:tetratricopeptide (TPR) repeat protein